jgi:hypothetical protein
MYEISPLRILCQRAIQRKFGTQVFDALTIWGIIASDFKPKEDLTRTLSFYKLVEKSEPVYEEIKDIPKYRVYDKSKRFYKLVGKQQLKFLSYELHPAFLWYEIVTVEIRPKQHRGYIISAKFGSSYFRRMKDGKFNDDSNRWVPWQDMKLIDKYIDSCTYSWGN